MRGLDSETQVIQMKVSLSLHLLPLKADPWQAAQDYLTCPTSTSVWNFLAATPDVVNIEAPLLYLKEGIRHRPWDKYSIHSNSMHVLGESNSWDYLFPLTMFMASSMLSAWETRKTRVNVLDYIAGETNRRMDG